MSHGQTLSVYEFQAKWRPSVRRERAFAQEHFTDLCRMVGFPTPAEADPAGIFYTFERGVITPNGRRGFADVWYRGRFAWEYKGKDGDLDKAYRQLQNYREDLENPPLLVVSDMDLTQVRTNFTGTAPRKYEFNLDSLDQAEHFSTLRAVFTDPDALKPGQTVEVVTEEAAARFARLASALEARGFEPHRVAHFLVQVLFCLFAEDVGLLPKRLFTDLVGFGTRRPELFPEQTRALFEAMRSGGIFALHEINRFNGGLFAEIDVLSLCADELRQLAASTALDWSSVEPAIFGTLFERSLDPAKRRQLGAHYTSRQDIERVVESVVMAPLRRRWGTIHAEADRLKARWSVAPNPSEATKRKRAFARLLAKFQNELAHVTILDPACGSGNFLYVALAKLEDLEKEVSRYAATNGLSYMLPLVRPTQLRGLEVNPYARELAQVVVWIGYLQWMRDNGFQPERNPVLEPLEMICLQDALVDRSGCGHVVATPWPTADFVIGNPPFLGGKRLRSALGDETVEELFTAYEGRVPREADLCCYFFEKARAEIDAGRIGRAGLLATNSIRGGANRRVLDRIKGSGDIFMAWSDEPWILDGAAVRISIVGFDGGQETERKLNGLPATVINPNLTATTDVTAARVLPENQGLAFMGDTKGGPFDIPGDLARQWLGLPLNPNGLPNSDVVRLWVNGLDITRRPRDMWIIDFGVDMPQHEASLYEAPFEYVQKHVKPLRDQNKRASYRERWWLHVEPRPGMRRVLDDLRRFICTPTVAKHRLFAWSDGVALPDHQLIIFARDDDYFFGVLHSRAHEIWSLRMGTWLGVGNDPRYTPTTCFETFPFPRPDAAQQDAIGAAAKRLNDLRRKWLNPEGADAVELKKRTLTNLYNARPTWLAQAHATLDAAVWAAYGWDDADPATVEKDVILARLLALNLVRTAEREPVGRDVEEGNMQTSVTQR